MRVSPARARRINSSFLIAVCRELPAATTDIDARDHEGQPGDWDIQAVTRRNKQGYATELSLPLSMVRKRQGDDWQSLQMAVAARVLWRGTADFDRRNANYGHFAPSD